MKSLISLNRLNRLWLTRSETMLSIRFLSFKHCQLAKLIYFTSFILFDWFLSIESDFVDPAFLLWESSIDKNDDFLWLCHFKLIACLRIIFFLSLSPFDRIQRTKSTSSFHCLFLNDFNRWHQLIQLHRSCQKSCFVENWFPDQCSSFLMITIIETYSCGLISLLRRI